MLATLSRRVVTPQVARSCRMRPSHLSCRNTGRSFTTSRSAAAASDDQQTGSLEQMSVNDLSELLANPVQCEEVQFVDVREQWEYDTAQLPHFKLFPLSQASSWAANIDQQLDPDTETVVLCHHGMRSMQMAGFLVSKGFKTVKNVTGGIAAYSRVDRSVPEY